MSIYQTCYDLINTYIFGGTVVVETYPDLVCIALATCASIFVFCIPFIVVYNFFLKRFF